MRSNGKAKKTYGQMADILMLGGAVQIGPNKEHLKISLMILGSIGCKNIEAFPVFNNLGGALDSAKSNNDKPCGHILKMKDGKTN